MPKIIRSCQPNDWTVPPGNLPSLRHPRSPTKLVRRLFSAIRPAGPCGGRQKLAIWVIIVRRNKRIVRCRQGWQARERTKTMKAQVICGSRNPEGQTARALEAFRSGLASAGCESEVSFLPTLKIERCRQCEDTGWGLCRKEGRCVIEDDLHVLVEKLRAAEVVAFATPVYFSDLSESLRAFLDRLRRTCMHEDGKRGLAGKPAIGVCVAGGGGGGAPSCIVSLEKVLARCGFDVVDLVPIRRQNLELKLDVLQTTGAWLARQVGDQ
jgi:multimeric flavodoxin WrbA